MLLREFTDRDMAELALAVRERILAKFSQERFQRFVKHDPEVAEELIKASWVALRAKLEKEGH